MWTEDEKKNVLQRKSVEIRDIMTEKIFHVVRNFFLVDNPTFKEIKLSTPDNTKSIKIICHHL